MNNETNREPVSISCALGIPEASAHYARECYGKDAIEVSENGKSATLWAGELPLFVAYLKQYAPTNSIVFLYENNRINCARLDTIGRRDSVTKAMNLLAMRQRQNEIRNSGTYHSKIATTADQWLYENHKARA